MTATMNISLPDSLREFVEHQTSSGGFSSASEYVRALIRREWKEHARSGLEARLIEGLESGEARELSPADWERMRREARRRASAGRRRT